MTRMRMVGLFGMSASWPASSWWSGKSSATANFVWLVRRHLWALALAVYLFSITPVDALVHQLQRAADPGRRPGPVGADQRPSDRRRGRSATSNRWSAARTRSSARACWPCSPSGRSRPNHPPPAANSKAGRPFNWPIASCSNPWNATATIGAITMNPDLRHAARQRFDNYAYQWY